MHVAVGSGNPLKRRAVSRTLGERADRVTLVAVDSGVPDQPWGHTETLQGAENRARRALSAGGPDATHGVGLEGGVCRHEHTPGLYVLMWGVATDGETVSRAAGPQFRLPEPVAEAVVDGRELGPVLDDHLGRTGTKHAGGAAGHVSAGLTDRTAALGQAVAGAVGPLLE